jgi:hypothetical protein
MNLKQVKEEYKKVFYLEDKDDGVLDVAIATVLSTYMGGDPIWTTIVGPSSGGKSEIVNAFSDIEFVHPISDMTENTLLSGSNADNASLLDKIGPIGCITMKDFTTVLSMRSEKRTMIIAQFRELYDGELVKKTGSGKNPSWKGKMTFLSGVTDAIYTADTESGVMGQRAIHFVLAEMDKEGRIKTTKAARKNRAEGNIKEKREHIRLVFKDYIESMVPQLPANIPNLPDDVSDEIINLTEMTTRSRTGISRDFTGQKITMVTSVEMPMRVSEQIHALGGMFMLMNEDKQLNEQQKAILFKVCIDCIPKNRREALIKLATYRRISAKGLAMDKGWNTDTARTVLEDLNVLRIIDRNVDASGVRDLWFIIPEYKAMLVKHLSIKEIFGDLDFEDGEGGTDPYDFDPGALREQNEVADREWDAMVSKGATPPQA